MRMGKHPLTSPETGLRRYRCVAEGDETRAMRPAIRLYFLGTPRFNARVGAV